MDPTDCRILPPPAARLRPQPPGRKPGAARGGEGRRGWGARQGGTLPEHGGTLAPFAPFAPFAPRRGGRGLAPAPPGHPRPLTSDPLPLAMLALALLLAAAATSTAAAWRERRLRLTTEHPLYGRPIERGELPSLLALIEAAWKLPRSPELSVVYLIQGEEDVSAAEEAMWGGGADVFVSTFRTQRRDALFFPNSLLAEGRNVLLAAAAMEEYRRGHRYEYYVFLDADSDPHPPWPESLQRFEAFPGGVLPRSSN